MQRNISSPPPRCRKPTRNSWCRGCLSRGQDCCLMRSIFNLEKLSSTLPPDLERLRTLLRQDSVLRAASLQPISRCRCWILPEPNRSPQALPKSNIWNRQPNHWQPRMAHSPPCYVSRGYNFSPTAKVGCERCIAS